MRGARPREPPPGGAVIAAPAMGEGVKWGRVECSVWGARM